MRLLESVITEEESTPLCDFTINVPIPLDPSTKSLIRESYNEAIKTIRENGCSGECAYIDGQIEVKLDALDSSASLWVRKLGKTSRLLYLAYIDIDPKHQKGGEIVVSMALRFSLVAALFYLVNPFDIIPDYVAGTGYTDDAFIVNKIVSMFETQLPGLLAAYESKLA